MGLKNIYVVYALAWLVMPILAVLNGLVRETFYVPLVGILGAHQLSTVVLLAVFMVYNGYIVHRFTPVNYKQAWVLGCMWALLTLFFEFGLGYIRHISWRVMLHDYNITEGRIWIIIPLWLWVSPALLYAIWGRYKQKS